MKINNHKLVAETGGYKVSFKESNNVSGAFKKGFPNLIILHYTAGASMSSSVAWLRNPNANASAHLVVGKSGEIVQLVPFNIKAWHAGRSEWKGRKRLNHSTIGIEIDNAGLLHKRVDGYYSSFGKKIENENVVLAVHKHQTEVTAWEAYTEEQIESVEQACLAIMQSYNIEDILGHEDVSKGRKVDPGPAFPMNSFREKVLFGRADDGAEVEEFVPLGEGAVVTAELLNIRRKASVEAMKAGEPLSRGTKLLVKKSEGNWSYVEVKLEGWVSNNWIKKI